MDNILHNDIAAPSLNYPNEWIRSIFFSAPTAIVIVDHEAKIVNWNPKAEEIFGWPAAEAIGQPMLELIIARNADQAAFQQLQNCFTNPGVALLTTGTIETVASNKDGTEFHIQVSISSVEINGQNLFITFINNIQDRKKIEERQAILASIVDSSIDAIIGQTLDGSITNWNPGAQKLYGYQDQEIIGKHISILIPENRITEEYAIIDRIKNGQAINPFETERLRKDGAPVFISLSVSPIKDLTGKIIGVSKIARDISEHKKNQEKIKQLNHSLLQHIQKLRNANEELESFSYSVSHDLRAPLRAINGYARIILDDYESKIDSEVKKFFEIIVSNAKKMGLLIDGLLAFSRTGRKDLERTTLNVGILVNTIVESFRSTIDPSTNIIIHPLASAYADFALLEQVFTNLISNALKYTSKSAHPTIEIGCIERELETVFFVKDNGVGFDMRYYNKLFGVFQRLHSVRDFEGTGVGLALVKRIIDKHGGRVWAESAVNEGSTFYFSLPKL